MTPAEVRGGSRRRAAAYVRYAVSYVGVDELGLLIAQVAQALGVSPPVVRDGLERGGPLLEARGVAAGAVVAAVRRKAS